MSVLKRGLDPKVPGVDRVGVWNLGTEYSRGWRNSCRMIFGKIKSVRRKVVGSDLSFGKKNLILV